MRGSCKPSAPSQEMVCIACAAIVAVARKLAGILHRMWVSEADFKVGFGSALRRPRITSGGRFHPESCRLIW